MAEELFSQSLASSQKETNIRHKVFRKKKVLAVFVTISSSPKSNTIVWGGEGSYLNSRTLFLRLSKNSLNTKNTCLHMDDYTGL